MREALKLSSDDYLTCFDDVASKFAVTITKIDILATDYTQSVRWYAIEQHRILVAFSIVNSHMLIAYNLVSI